MPSLNILFCYGFTAFPLAAAFITLQVFIPTHYAELTSLSLTTIGSIILLARLWDTITDPIIGILSDKTPTHWGRRRLWVWTSMPFIGLSTYMLFNPTPNSDSHYLLAWTFAVYLSGTMAIVPLTGWGAELSTNYQYRNRITGIRAFFGLLGTLAALSIPALLTKQTEPHSSTINLVDSLSAITFLILFSLAFAALLLHFVPDKQALKLPDKQFRAAIALFKHTSPFRTLLLCFLSNSIANAIPATLFLFYISDILMAPDYAGPILFLYFICAIISIPFWVKVANHFGKQQTWQASIIVACLFFSLTPFLSQNDMWLYLIVVIATGICTGCDLTIPSSMNGDLIEWDTVNSGYRRPGLFFALWGTTTKFAYALAIGIAFPLLDSFGFSAQEQNSQTALTALAWMYGLPCVIFKLIALIGMQNYPINKVTYQSILAENEKLSPTK